MRGILKVARSRFLVCLLFIEGEKMARIARKYLETEYYHIMVQGIDRNYIFLDDKMKENIEN